MNPNAKLLIDRIESLKNSLEAKKNELRYIQKRCHHVWPKKWSERTGLDYRNMGNAVDFVFRKNSPEIITVQYKNCEICGKEKIKQQ